MSSEFADFSDPEASEEDDEEDYDDEEEDDEEEDSGMWCLLLGSFSWEDGLLVQPDLARCMCVCACVCDSGIASLELQGAPLTIIFLDLMHIVCPRRVSSFQKECTPKMINSKMKMK